MESHDQSVESLIESFYEQYGGIDTTESYYRFDTGGRFEYVFPPTASGANAVAEQVDGGTYQERLGASFFRLSGVLSTKILELLPQIEATRIGSSDTPAFQCAIVSSKTVTLLCPQSDIVVQIGRTAGVSFREDYETLRNLPEDLNAPTPITVDDDVPYFIQEYIEGRSIKNLKKEWPYLLGALEQLRTWSQSEGLELVTIDDAVDDLRDGLSAYDQPVVEAAFRDLERGSLPDQLAYGLTHGDITIDNLIISDGEPHLIDWVAGNSAYIFRDFFFPFFHWCWYGGGSRDLLEQFKSESGRGGEIVNEYARSIGPTAWRSEEWFPDLLTFGLLYELTLKPANHSRSKNVLQLLETLEDQ